MHDKLWFDISVGNDDFDKFLHVLMKSPFAASSALENRTVACIMAHRIVFWCGYAAYTIVGDPIAGTASLLKVLSCCDFFLREVLVCWR